MARFAEQRPRRKQGRAKPGVAVGISVLLILAVFVYLAWSESVKPRVVLDWRLKLTVHDSRTGGNTTLPAGIGVEGGFWANNTLDKYGPPGYAPLSTRDESGIVYIQSTRCDREFCAVFTFGDLFNIFGHPFDRNCVWYYCGGRVDPSNPPPFISDGEADFCLDEARGKILSNGKDWVIFIGSNALALFCG